MIFCNNMDSTSAGGPSFESAEFDATGPWQYNIYGPFGGASVTLLGSTKANEWNAVPEASTIKSGQWTIQSDAGAKYKIAITGLTDASSITATSGTGN